MALVGNPKHWALASYTNGTWNNVVAEGADAVLASVVVANTSAGPIAVSLRLATAAGAAIATILPPATVAAGTSQRLDLRSLSLQSGTNLQMQADATGAHITASGTV